MAKPKKYKCREKAEGCEGEYVKWSSFQATCPNHACALKKAKRDRLKKEAADRAKTKREKKEWRLANRTIKGWCQDARQDGFQPFVRERDKDEPCISCGKTTASIWHAGHFMSVGSRPELQFHPANCNRQCPGCNLSRKSISHKYRAGMVAKWGVEMTEYLENYHRVLRLTVDEIKEVKKHFRSELARLKTENSHEM